MSLVYISTSSLADSGKNFSNALIAGMLLIT